MVGGNMRGIIYKIENKPGIVKICSTVWGSGYVKSRSGICLVELPSVDEMECERLRWVSRFLKQGYVLLNSKRDVELARKLFMWEKKRHPGNSVNLVKGKKVSSPVDILDGL
jgi:hypothetical protein